MKRFLAFFLVASIIGGCEMTPEQEQNLILGLQRMNDQYQRQQMLRQAQQPQMLSCTSNGWGNTVTTNCHTW